MLKRMGKKIITGLMIALMVVGIFVSIANFTANNVLAVKKGGDDFDAALVYIFGEDRYDCATDWHINCIIVTP
jgi:hypothetical protein